jgi:hypothetical protein
MHTMCKTKMCQEADLNRRHEDFQSSALPTELSRLRSPYLQSCIRAGGANIENALLKARIPESQNREPLSTQNFFTVFRSGRKDTHVSA